MIEDELVLDVLPDTDEYFMVTWINDIWKRKAYDTNPYIGIKLVKLSPNSDLASCLDIQNWQRDSEKKNNFQNIFKNIKLSDLPLVTVGSVWKRKKQVQQLSRKNNFECYKIKIFGKDKFPRNIIMKPNFFKQGEWHWASSPCLQTYAYHNGQMIEIYIPCAELARFYWGTSTTFFRDLIVNGIDEKLSWVLETRQIPTSEKLYITEENEFVIWMKSEYSDLDAISVSRFFGPDQEARIQAALLHRSLEIAAMQRKQSDGNFKDAFYLQTGFPFSDGTKLKIFGKYLEQSQGIPKLFVFRIAQCFHNAPFQSVRRKVIKNESEKKEEGSNNSYTPNKHYRQSRSYDEEIITNREAGANKHLQKSIREINPFPTIRKNCRFKLDLQKVKTAERLTNNSLIFDEKYVSGGESQDGDISVGRYRSEIRINPSEILNKEPKKEKKETEHNRRIIEEYFKLLVEAFEVLNNEKKELKKWAVLRVIDDKSMEKKSQVCLSYFPLRSDGRKYAWTNMPNRDETRCCLWIECLWEDYYIYLCEWEKRKDNSAIYSLMLNGGEQALEENLYNAMQKWAMKQHYRSAEGLNSEGWYRLSIPHFHKRENENKFKLAEKIKTYIKETIYVYGNRA